MKRNKILTLSIAALLGFGTVSALGIHANGKKTAIASNSAFEDSVTVDSIGSGIDFGNHIKRAGEFSQVSETIGVQLLDGVDGKKSLRFIAALTSYAGLESASWTRAAIVDGETTVKEQYTAPVSKVYTSIANSESIKWSTTLDTTYQYYMVYTLANIPSAFDFAKIDVTFNATALGASSAMSATQTANVKGVEGSLNVFGKYTYDSTTKEYSISRGDGFSSLTDVTIPEDHYEVEKYVAKNPGKVTAAKTVSSTGTFEGASNMKHLRLPATLKSWENYFFYSNSSLESVNFPRDLTGWTGTSQTLPTSSKFQDLYWEATNLVTFASKFSINIPTIHIAASVEHLPTASIFDSGKGVSKIIYEGTTAQWNALIAGSEASGLDIDNVICSDTEFVDITFNANGGKFADETETTTVNAVKGKKVTAPTNPVKSGEVFDGWYTAAEGGTLVDIASPTTANQTYYAHYKALVGETFEKKIAITTTGEGTFDILGERQTVYASFTAPAADRYYIKVDASKCNLEGDYANYSGTISKRQDNSYTKVIALNEDGTEMADVLSKATTYKNKKPAAITSDRAIVVDLAEGESINLKFISSTYASYTNLSGTLAYNIFTSDGDTEDTAVAMELGTDVNVTNGTQAQNYIYKQFKFTSTETKTKTMSFTYSTSTIYGGFTVKEAGEEGAVLKDASSITSAGLFSINLTAEKEYIVSVYVTTNLTDKTLSFKIEDEPAGMSKDNPIVDAVAVGSTTTIARIGTSVTWYKLDLAAAGSYKISWSNDQNMSYDTRLVKVYDSTGTKIAGDTYSSYSSTKYFTFDVAEAATVYIEVGFSSSSTTDKSKKFDISVEQLVAGSSRESAISTDLATLVSEGTLTLNASADGVWYKFKGTAEEFDWSTSSETASIQIYTSLTGSSPSYTITNAAAKCKTTGTSTYYAKVVETDTSKTTATIVKTTHVGPLKDSETLGTYYGRYAGSSSTYTYAQTWKEVQDGLSWGGSTINDATSTEVKDGIRETHAVTGSYDYFSFSDGTRTIAGYWYSSYGYVGYFSKNVEKQDNVTSSNSECVKTASFSLTSGSMIFKITETGDNVTYGAIIDGKVYLDVEVVMMSDSTTIRSPKDSKFQLKKDGVAFAQYHVSTAATGTSCAIVTPEEVTEYVPQTEVAYAGNWEDGEGNTISIEKNGKSGTINGDAATFGEPDKDGTVYVDSGDWEGSTFTYDSENDILTDIYFLNNDTSDNFEDDFTRAVPAAPSYCGVYKTGSYTLTINADGTVSWHDGSNEYTASYTWDETEKAGKMGALAAWDREAGNKFYFSGDDYNSVKVSFNDEWGENFYSATLTRVAA